MKSLLILGAGGHGKVCADIAQKMGCWGNIFFLDDFPKETVLGYSILGGLNDLSTFGQADYDAFAAIGDAQLRLALLESLEQSGYAVPVLVHPTAVVGANVTIGAGSVLMANAVINPESVLGGGCIVNTGATVDHDCKLAEGVHVSVGAHIAGTVEIGARTWIGIGACVSNNISICGDCMIGAGATVVTDIIAPGTYVGIPARGFR